MINAQEWLDREYPSKNETYKIYINKQLEGEMDVSGYNNLCRIYIYSQVDEVKINFKLSKNKKVDIVALDVQKWLDKNYPKKRREWIKEIHLNESGLEGKLNLVDFRGVKVYIYPQVDRTRLSIENLPKYAEIVKLIRAQEWLDTNYPKKRRSEVKEIYLNEPTLEGKLDLSDFTHYEFGKGVKVYISYYVHKINLIKKNQPKYAEIVKLISVEEYFKQEYPIKKEREKVTKIDIENKNLEGVLDLSEFINLKELNCHWNKLTSLNVSKCSRLERIDCSDNLLTNLVLSSNLVSLQSLKLSSNSFPSRDLSFLTGITNLKDLWLEDNKLTGSLDYLSNMKKLKRLYISDTDFNEVDVTKLPESLEKISYSTRQKNCELNDIISQLQEYEWKDLHPNFTLELRRKWGKAGFNKEQSKEWILVKVDPKDYRFISYLKEIKKVNLREFSFNKDKENYQELREKCNKFDWCRNCQQVNISENWCQFCMKKEWQEDIKNLTGQELIEKFIKSKQLELQWISYRQFSNIKLLAEGGFSKIYKANWRKNVWSGDIIVVLKSLNNSQNITLEFLSEIANYRLVNSDNGLIVKCYGISQDPKTENYTMVMEYMNEGNLRKCLGQRGKELSFYNKLHKLENIASGLKTIHEQGLVHCDFHSGNILNSKDWHGFNSFISDLGLSRPADSQKEEGKIFGVLPYVAPEVLRGQPYAQKADIYSFGIIMYELLANSYPYPDLDEVDLALKICGGSRPKIDELRIPQMLKDLIKGCWDVNSEKRPTAGKVERIINDWYNEIGNGSDTEFFRQYKKIEKKYNHFIQTTPYRIHSKAVTTSKLINTKQITEKLKTMEYSQSLAMDFTNLNLEEKQTDQEQIETQTEQPPYGVPGSSKK